MLHASKNLNPHFLNRIDADVDSMVGPRATRRLHITAGDLAKSARKMRRLYPDASFTLTAIPEGVPNAYNRGYPPPAAPWIALAYDPEVGYRAEVRHRYVPRTPFGTGGDCVRVDSLVTSEGDRTREAKKRLA